MAIADKINSIRTHLGEAYASLEEKGATIPDNKNIENLSDSILSIEGGGEEGWKPQEDWWNIDKILEEDTENYSFKVILLMRNNKDTLIIPSSNAWYSKIKTSDGSLYTDFTSDITHTWNKEYDKNCNLGYKTRYIIFYNNGYNQGGYTNNNVFNNIDIDGLYIIFKTSISSELNFFARKYLNLSYLQAVKMINVKLGDREMTRTYNHKSLKAYLFENCTTTNVTGINFESGNFIEQRAIDNVINLYVDSLGKCAPTTLQTSFENLYNVKYIKNLDTSLVTTFNRAFNNCYSLESIDELDFNSVTTWGGNAFACRNLTTINSVKNLKLTGLSLSSCPLLTKETLLRILNALYDYSSEGGTHTITFGTINLAKLTDSEKAIATGKGWTLS